MTQPPQKLKPLRDEGWVSFGEGARILGKHRVSIHRYVFETGEISPDDVRSVDDGTFYVVRLSAIQEIAKRDQSMPRPGEVEDFTELRTRLRDRRREIRTWGESQGLCASRGYFDQATVVPEYEKAHGLAPGSVTEELDDLAHRAEEAKAELGHIREWGRENGFDVAVKGYLPPRLMAAYRKAHPAPSKQAS